MACAIAAFPVASLRLVRESRIGTPLVVKVASVRENLETVDLFIIAPKIGNLNFVLSMINRVLFIFPRILYSIKAPNGIAGMNIHCVFKIVLKVMSTLVGVGNSKFNSSNIFAKFGMIKIMSPIKILIATTVTTVGYIIALIIFLTI